MSRIEYRLRKPGEITINGKPTDVFYLTWSEGRRSKRITTGTADPDRAFDFLVDFRRASAEQRSDDKRREGRALTVADVVKEWRTRYAPKLSNRNPEYAMNRIVDAMGSVPFVDVQPDDLDTFAANEVAKGRSEGAIRYDLIRFRAVVSWAVRARIVDARDAPIIVMPEDVNDFVYQPRQRFLTTGEFQRLLNAAATPHLQLALYLLIYTLARHNRVVSLKWEDVDFDAGVIWFAPKTSRRSRKNYVPVPIHDALRVQLQAAKTLARSEYVIEWRGEPVKGIRTSFEKALERAGLRDVRVHDLRRTGASWMVQAGVDIARVAALLGDTVEATERHYAVFSPQCRRAGIDALPDLSPGGVVVPLRKAAG